MVRFSKEETTALKAVLFGCVTNKKIEDSFYFNRSTGEQIGFEDAATIVGEMIFEENEP